MHSRDSYVFRAARLLVSAIVLLCGALSPSLVLAAPIIWITDGRSLATVDIANQSETWLGRHNSTTNMTDIAFDPTGNLFGVGVVSEFDAEFNQTIRYSLFSIDTSTGNATVIGEHGIGAVNLVFGSDGTLYASESFAGGPKPLYSIDPVTAQATELGNIDFAATGDLAFFNNRLLMTGFSFMSIGAGALIEIDLANLGIIDPAATEIGLTSGYNNVWGIANGGDGVLYGGDGTSMLAIDPNTGAATFLFSFGSCDQSSSNCLSGTSGFAVLGESAVAAVPLPASAWLLATAVGLLAPRVKRKAKLQMARSF